LQGAVYGENGSVFDCCVYCAYDCYSRTRIPAEHYREVFRKLQLLTGVDLSLFQKTHSSIFKSDVGRFLKASNSTIKQKIIETMGIGDL
jgi:hypothetical protein